jgi:cellobiose phosphorylase
VPASWGQFRVRWNHGGCRYTIAVENPRHTNNGVLSATLDGVPVDPAAIPLANDGGKHMVRVVMGDPARVPAALGPAAPAS